MGIGVDRRLVVEELTLDFEQVIRFEDRIDANGKMRGVGGVVGLQVELEWLRVE